MAYHETILDAIYRLQKDGCNFPCPRCGGAMRIPVSYNSLSRHNSVYVCERCGAEEAMQDWGGKVKPASEWWLFTELLQGKQEENMANTAILNRKISRLEENIVNIAMRAAMLLHTGQIAYDETTGHTGMTEQIVALAAQFEAEYKEDFNESEKDYWEEIDRFADDKLLWLYAAEPAETESGSTFTDPKAIIHFDDTSPEEMNCQLYLKMDQELDDYRMKLMEMEPEEILRHAYDLSLREDIVMAMENNNLEPAEAAALLQLDQPLEAAVQAFESGENSSHMDEMWQAIENAASAQFDKVGIVGGGNHSPAFENSHS